MEMETSAKIITNRIRGLEKKIRIIDGYKKPFDKVKLEKIANKPSLKKEIEILKELSVILPTAIDKELSLARCKYVAGVVKDLLELLYFGNMFDYEDPKMMMMSSFESLKSLPMSERTKCLYDAEEDLDLEDLDLISEVKDSVMACPTDSLHSHLDAIHKGVHHALLWLSASHQPISPNSDVTYAAVRDKLNKVLALDYALHPQLPAVIPAQYGDANQTTTIQPLRASTSDGPILNVIRECFRKYQELLDHGESLNDDEHALLGSYEIFVDICQKLNLPTLPDALNRETTLTLSAYEVVKEIVQLVYFGCLFDMKYLHHINDYRYIMLTRRMERHCCLDEALNSQIGIRARDLDLISGLKELIVCRPMESSFSHLNAIEECVEHALLWHSKSDQPMYPQSDYTYGNLREKLDKILVMDYAVDPSIEEWQQL